MQEDSASSALSVCVESGKGQPGQHLEQSCSSFSVGLKMVIPLTCTSGKWFYSCICKSLCVSSQLWTPTACLISGNLNRFLYGHLSLWIVTYPGIHWANPCTQQGGEQDHRPREFCSISVLKDVAFHRRVFLSLLVHMHFKPTFLPTTSVLIQTLCVLDEVDNDLIWDLM